ncbi:SDR family oxidoreductase [Smaragdicoccus niigatensis]|uniref:SDR family oxidoreductase n=1 Tax=Smaragdicoccus niigatensis TaxID=359359 RepID=UPI00035C74F0|nr:SDR family oxidoreductase [Smaragdicoccus niigatensis]
MSRDRSIEGKVVAITGAARGIGYATAAHLLSQGARVAIGDIDAAAVRSAATSLARGVVALQVDVSNDESVAAFIAAAEDALGTLDILINNAGIMPIGHFLEQSQELQRRTFDINVYGVLNGMRAALPGMIERGSGHIINVASSAGKAPVPGGLVYGATKAAVASLTDTARIEFAGDNIDFTSILPAFTNTDLIAGTKGLKGFKTVEPEDVAQAIADAISHPVPEKWVPGSLAGTAAIFGLIPYGVRDRINRALGAYDAFLDVDQSARKVYDDRITQH